MTQGTKPNPPAYPIESVDNALRLLLMFREQPLLRVAEASRKLGVAASTAHRLLAMLQYHGFVVQDPRTKAYRAGAALTDIGLAVVRDMDVRTLARPVMESLARELGETVHLALIDRAEIVFVDSIESTQVVRVGSRIGVRLPAHLTSLGKAMLAHLPEERLKALYPSEILPGRTANSTVRRKALLRALGQIAERGYAINDRESEEEVCAIGVAILTAGGSPTAGISVSTPQSRFDDRLIERVVPVLRAAAAKISEQL
jgi:DNA-binding IclR family transcriptional regulator